MSERSRCAILGVGESERSREAARSILGMALDAARSAIEDAGLEPRDIDCVMSYQEADSCGAQDLAAYLGIEPCAIQDIQGGGASLEGIVATAVGLIEAGLVRHVLIFRSMLGRSGRRMGAGAGWSMENLEAVMARGPYLVRQGVGAPGQRVALVAAQHLHDTKMGEEVLGTICTTLYAHAQRNERAMMYGRPLSLDEYLASPYLATPLRLHDYCVETDEANAIVVGPLRQGRAPHGGAGEILGIVPKEAMKPSFHFESPTPTVIAADACAHRLWDRTGLSASDVDVAAIYDCFSWVVLRQLESYGFVQGGGAADFVMGGQLGMEGRLPVNTAGGMLAEGYTHGMNNVVELVRQLRRHYEGTSRQAPRTRVGLATGWGGPNVASAMLLAGRA